MAGDPIPDHGDRAARMLAGAGGSRDALNAVIGEVADRTRQCPVTIWGFGVGGALTGLVRAGRRLGRADLVAAVTDLIEPSLHAQPGPTDHLISVETLVALAESRPDLDVGDACARWSEAVLSARPSRPGGPRVHRPDLNPWASTIWVDCMHTDGPGLSLLGQHDEAVTYASEYSAVLQRDDGLFHHGYDTSTERGNGVAWGRGQAWALLGLVELLTVVDDTTLRHRLDRLVEALARHARNGRWHTIVDQPDSPVENSVAAYVALGVGRAARRGLVDASYGALADRAYAVTVGSLVDGELTVSEATPVGDADNYRARAAGAFPWGQAPVLHALLDRLRDGDSL